MGYRSEVALAVSKDAMAQFLTTLAKSPPARQLCFEFSDEVVKDYEDEEGALLFKWTQIKWYEGYEPMDALEAFVNENEEQTRLVRCGEEGDDTEEKGDLFSELIYPRIHNSIEIN